MAITKVLFKKLALLRSLSRQKSWHVAIILLRVDWLVAGRLIRMHVFAGIAFFAATIYKISADNFHLLYKFWLGCGAGGAVFRFMEKK